MFNLVRKERSERYLRWPKVVEENAEALQMQMTVEEAGIMGEMGGGSVFDMSNEELQDFIMDMFLQFDADASGYLDRKEFKGCMQSSELGLSKKEIRRIMSEADENADGVLEYREFVPVMVEVIHGLKAKAAATEAATAVRPATYCSTRHQHAF